MSIHRYSSWGRTKGPKKLNEELPLDKQGASTVTPVAAAALNNQLSGSAAGTNGYATQNQKYLHLQIENNGTDDTLELYGYNYAFNSWAKFYLPLGISLDGSGADTSVVNDAYIETKWTTISGSFMVTVPINGVDRVAFVHDGTLNDMVVRAACSTI